MANPDKPRGFTPIKHTSGSPWTGQTRTITPKNGVDIFIGDVLNLDTGTADVGATNDAAFLGVAVGFGKVADMSAEAGPAFNPTNLTTLFYDDSANTNTEWLVFFVPVRDMVFEVQTAVDLSASVIGATVDLLATAGNTTTGRSNQEVTTNSNADFVIVERPSYADNDATLVNERLFVQVVQAETAFN